MIGWVCRVGEGFGEKVACEFMLPQGYNDRSYAVADHIDEGSKGAEETVDAKDQRHACNRDGGNDYERSHQGDEACALHSAGAFGCKDSDGEEGELLGKRDMRVGGLGYK